jgi:hypothetical protein
MSNYLNIGTFLLTTYVYYLIFRPKLSYNTLLDENEVSVYFTNSYTFLAIYFFAVIIIQMIVNVNFINEKCGGSSSENIGYAGMVTILPWTLIFGILIVVLTIYPGFKSAFSDVIGYYWVSNSANSIITELLIDRNVQQELSESIPQSSKNEIDRAADAIIKICGNTGVLINQMTPQNFQNFWEILTPLKKKQYRKGTSEYNESETTKKINELFDLVVTKDNIGESMWYIYTGLLVTAVVQLKISSKGCVSNLSTMEKNYQKFRDGQKATQEKTAAKQENKTSFENLDYSSLDFNSVNSNVRSGLDTANSGSEYVLNSNTEQNNL